VPQATVSCTPPIGRCHADGSDTLAITHSSTKWPSHFSIALALPHPNLCTTTEELATTQGGGLRTTHQAFTIRNGKGPYSVRVGEDVMTSLVAGWPVYLEEHFVKAGDSEGMLRAAAGWDIFLLCPDRALSSFEAAAKLSNPVSAYNAAMIRLERGDEGDHQAAMTLLSQAANLGDEPARDRLRQLKRAETGTTPQNN
jgi:hypothetical protein